MPESLHALPHELQVILAFAVLLLLLLALIYVRRPPRGDARIHALEAELHALRARIEALETQPPTNSALDPQLYAEAQRLARTGADSAELAAQLGISRAEAELIIALQKGAP
ncbi:MAG: DUF2802 domain-containing protein [Betaproteobacteria bacterium]|nr:DUF2802 domain-containing protein [Betaproteobacteria bacterium]